MDRTPATAEALRRPRLQANRSGSSHGTSGRASLARAITTATGFAWLCHDREPARLQHRRALGQLILTYPAKRLWPQARLERLGVVAAYARALVYPDATNHETTIAFPVLAALHTLPSS